MYLSCNFTTLFFVSDLYLSLSPSLSLSLSFFGTYCCSLLSIISIGNWGTSYGAESSLECRAGSGGESVPDQKVESVFDKKNKKRSKKIRVTTARYVNQQL